MSTDSKNTNLPETELDEALKALKSRARQVIEKFPETEWLFRMRTEAIDRGVDREIRDKELKQLLSQAQPTAKPLRGGDPIPLDELHEATGLWGDLLLSGCLNLVSAPPKVGKTALMLHLAACVFRGDMECLGVPILDRFEHLVIVGTDMDKAQWFKLFFREGLAHKLDDQVILDKRITLWDASSNIQLDESGCSLIREECSKHSNSLLLVDTLRSTTSSLGLDENRTEICGPIYALKMACASASVTAVVNHHTNKSVTGGSAITASAGNNAIPGACDNTILMNWAKDCPDGQRRTDFRITISSSGRGKGGSLVAAITDEVEGGCWKGYGEATAIEAVNRVRRVVQTLTGRQEDAYVYMLERWEGEHPTTGAQLAEFLQLKQTKKAWLVLNALESKGLIEKQGAQPTTGRPATLYRPFTIEEDLPPSFPPLPPSSGGYARGNGIKDGTPVQRLVNGEWKSGFVIADGTNPNALKVSPLGNSMTTYSNLRWELDVKEATGSPFANAPQQEQSTNQLPWE